MQLSRHYTSVRQPGNMGGENMEGQKLIFLYPFAVDQSLNKHANLCRDFFTVNFINEIKIENILNIISSASSSVGTLQSGSKSINPAEVIYKVSRQHHNAESQPLGNDYSSDRDPYFYKEKLDKFNIFIQNQLKHDPRYQKFRPIFSTLTIDAVLDIPLIVGTKSYSMDSHFLYLILMISIIYGISWDSDASVRRAITILKNLPPGSFSKLIASREFRREIEYLANIKSQSSNIIQSDSSQQIIQKKLDAYIKSQSQLSEIFFGVIFNKTKWETNFPEMTTGSNLSFNTVTINTRTQRKHYESSINTLNSYLSEYVVPLLHSIEIFTGPVDPSINVPDKIDTFISDIVSGLSDDFINLSNNINNGLLNINSTSNVGNANNAADAIEQLSGICEENANLGSIVEKHLNELYSNTRLNIAFSPMSLSSFVNNITTSGNQFHTLAETVNDWLLFISQNGSSQLVTSIRTIQHKIDQLIKTLLYQEYPTQSGHGPWIENVHEDQFPLRYYNYCSAFGITPYQNNLTQQYNYFKQAVGEIETALREMILFFVKWIFFSYTCSYLKDIDIDIQIQRRDALQFPNYCLVLPYKIFKDLYITQITKNFHTYLSDETTNVQTVNSRQLTLNAGDINSLFDIVIGNLNIPNLIIIDEFTNKCYYRFMYMTKPVSVNFATMESFVKHQNDILPGF